VFHYRRRDGWTNREYARFGGGIDPRRQPFGDFVADARASNCRPDTPCSIEHAELRDLRCRQ